MQHDYVPRRDADFAAWVAHYFTTVETFWNDHYLDQSELKDLQDAMALWLPAWPAHIAARAAADAAKESKDAARRAVEAALRPITRFVQAFPETTDADRANLGITISGANVSFAGRGTANVPFATFRPRITIDAGQRLTHRLRITDAATPQRRARPAFARAAEVYLALTPPLAPAPADPSAYRFHAAATRDTLTIPYPLAAAGQTAHVLARWIGSGGASGAWSEVASATVAG